MKFEVFKEPLPAVEEPVLFKLVKEGGCVRLIVVDKYGERGPSANILEITQSGSLRLFTAVNKKLGLVLDSVGKIVQVPWT